MSRPVTTQRVVAGSHAALADRLAGDPGRWLPEPARQRGLERWTVALAAGPAHRPVSCHVDTPWRIGEAVWRSVTWDPVDDPDDMVPVARALPVFRGEVGVRPDESGVAIVLRGSYTPPAGGLGTVADAAGLRRVAEATIEWFLDEVTSRLATDATELADNSPSS
jgi:hypothetical protein